MLIEEIKQGKGFSFDLGKLGKNFATAQQFLLTADFASLSLGRHEIDGDNVFVNMQEYTQEEKEPSYEAHAVYADIQLVARKPVCDLPSRRTPRPRPAGVWPRLLPESGGEGEG